MFDDYKIKNDPNDHNPKIDLAKVNQAICDNLIVAKNVARLNDFEAEIAIKYARKFGGFSNILDANGRRVGEEIILEEIKKDIRFNNSSGNALADHEYNKSAEFLLEKFKNFSAFVQQYNQECGIYSGRKDGKLVGLRLAFVSDEVGVKFSETLEKSAREVQGFGLNVSLSRYNQKIKDHKSFLSVNPRLSNAIRLSQGSVSTR